MCGKAQKGVRFAFLPSEIWAVFVEFGGIAPHTRRIIT